MKTYSIKEVGVGCGPDCHCVTAALVVQDEHGERVLLRAKQGDVSIWDVITRPDWVRRQDEAEANRLVSMQRLLKQAERKEGREVLNAMIAADEHINAVSVDVFSILSAVREEEQISENVMLGAMTR